MSSGCDVNVNRGPKAGKHVCVCVDGVLKSWKVINPVRHVEIASGVVPTLGSCRQLAPALQDTSIFLGEAASQSIHRTRSRVDIRQRAVNGGLIWSLRKLFLD